MDVRRGFVAIIALPCARASPAQLTLMAVREQRERERERERKRERERDGFDQLKDSIIASSRQIKDLMLNVSMASITGSYKICTSRNHHPDHLPLTV